MTLISYRQIVAQLRGQRSRPVVAQAGSFFPDEHATVDCELKEISHGFSQNSHHKPGLLANQLFDLRHRCFGTTNDALAGSFSEEIPFRRQVRGLREVRSYSDAMAKAPFGESYGYTAVRDVARGMNQAVLGQIGKAAVQS